MYLLSRNHKKPVLPWTQPYHQSQIFLTTFICKGYWVCWVRLQGVHRQNKWAPWMMQMERKPCRCPNNSSDPPAGSQHPVNAAAWTAAGPDGLTSACQTSCSCSLLLSAEAGDLLRSCQFTAGPEQDTLSRGNTKCQGLTSWTSRSSKITAISHWLAALDCEWMAHLKAWWGKTHKNSVLRCSREICISPDQGRENTRGWTYPTLSLPKEGSKLAAA